MRLQWWICGRSVSVCLTLWCISSGLNPFSITSVSPLLSLSLHLFFSIPSPRSLTLSDELLSGFLPQFWNIHHHADTSPSPTTKQQTGTELTICQLILTGGSSEIVHLTFWPNVGECRTGDAASVNIYDTSLLHWRQCRGSVMGTRKQIKAQPEEKCWYWHPESTKSQRKMLTYRKKQCWSTRWEFSVLC